MTHTIKLGEQFGYDFLCEQVKRKAHIMSEDIEFIDNSDDEWTSIFEGFHKIGECFIDGKQDEKAVIE